jgi:hypothetical protein
MNQQPDGKVTVAISCAIPAVNLLGTYKTSATNDLRDGNRLFDSSTTGQLSVTSQAAMRQR